MKNFTVLLLCILLLPVWATAQKGFVKEKLGEELDDLMTGFSKEGYSGAVLVAQKGKIILRKGYGLADRERKIQNTPSTLFNVASVGKIFTAAAVLKLEMLSPNPEKNIATQMPDTYCWRLLSKKCLVSLLKHIFRRTSSNPPV